MFWNKTRFQLDINSRVIEYHEWMHEGLEFARAVCNLHTYGLVFMRGVPKSWYSLVEIAGRLGNRQYTPRGLTWDDIVEAGKKSVASSDVRLQQDSVYLRDQPQIQFMHCLENDSPNDEVLFSDGLNTAWNLKRRDTRGFSALTTQLVNCNYRDGGQFFSSRRRVIQLGKGAKPVSIAWSPAFQGPFPLMSATTSTITSDSPTHAAYSPQTRRRMRSYGNGVEQPGCSGTKWNRRQLCLRID